MWGFNGGRGGGGFNRGGGGGGFNEEGIEEGRKINVKEEELEWA